MIIIIVYNIRAKLTEVATDSIPPTASWLNKFTLVAQRRDYLRQTPC